MVARRAHQLADAMPGAASSAATAAAAAGSATASRRLRTLPRSAWRARARAARRAATRSRWHENIPLLSWLRLRGRCSACGTRISPRYPLVELATALLFAAVGWRFGAAAADAAVVRLRGRAGRAGADRLGHHPAARRPDAAAAVGRPGRRRARLDAARCRTRCGAPSPATSRCGRSTGSSSSPPARKAWATATSSCSPRSAPGWAGR